MYPQSKTLQKFFLLALLVIAFMLSAMPAPAAAQDPTYALPPDFRLHGKTGNEWAAKWWQWTYKIPADGHPLNQTGEVDCSANQHGRVWFLGGTFNGTTPTVRTCTIPKNTYLWFPVLNWVVWRPGDCVTDQECHDLADWLSDATQNVVVTVDGDPIPNIYDYRYQSGPFKFKIPEGGIHQGDPNNTEYPHLIPGLKYDGVDDGYYMMLEPLPPGEHTIKFSADTPIFGGFAIDVTYHITVTN